MNYFKISILAIALFFCSCGKDEKKDHTKADEKIKIEKDKKDSAVIEKGNIVGVSLEEFDIVMPALLTAGVTKFRVTNNGSKEHSFEIEGQGIEKKLEANLKPGENETFELDLKPGKYTVYCPVGNHDEKGMKKEIKVQ